MTLILGFIKKTKRPIEIERNSIFHKKIVQSLIPKTNEPNPHAKSVAIPCSPNGPIRASLFRYPHVEAKSKPHFLKEYNTLQ